MGRASDRDGRGDRDGPPYGGGGPERGRAGGEPGGADPSAAPPERVEPVRLLLYPFQNGETIAVVSMGAALIFLLSLVPFFVKPFVVALALYPTAYLLDVVRAGMQGKRALPGWPDFVVGDLVDTGIKMLAVAVACFAPAILLAIPVAMATCGSLVGESGERLASIGPDAHRAATGSPSKAMGASASGAVFYATDGTAVSPRSGRWTVVGLLGRDDADDTGMSDALQEMPVTFGGFTAFPGQQAYDLDRVGRAFAGEDVDVLGAYADPSGRMLERRWPFLAGTIRAADGSPLGRGAGYDADADEAGYAGFDGDDDGEEGAGTAGSAAPAAAAATNPFAALRLVRADGFAFPAPFDARDGVPQVLIVDPAGKVVREYEMGVYDEKLYADLADLRWGGDGDASPRRLPAAARGVDTSQALVVLGWLAVIALYALGLFYYPMALLMVAGFESATVPFSYALGIRAIRASFRDYAVVVGIAVAVQVGAVVFMLPLGFLLRVLLPWWLEWLFVDFASQWLGFASALIGAYGMGLVYCANQDRIGWFARRPLAAAAGPGVGERPGPGQRDPGGDRSGYGSAPPRDADPPARGGRSGGAYIASQRYGSDERGDGDDRGRDGARDAGHRDRGR